LLSSELTSSLESAREVFGISDKFKWNDLLIRGGSEVKLTLASPIVRELLVRSAEGSLFAKEHIIKVINAGVRVLQNDANKNKKLGLQSHVRLTGEGLPFVMPFLSKQVITIDRELFEYLLKHDDAPLLDTITNEAMRAEIEKCSIGPIAVRVVGKFEKGNALDEARYWQPLDFPGWKGATSVRLSISKIDLKSLRNLYLSDNYDYDLTA